MRSFAPRVALTLALAALFPLPAQTQITAVPNSMNFQGRLATSSGNPVPDGTYSVRFSLWDAVSGGTEKWNKTVANVQVKNGTFAVTLDAFPAGTFSGNLWLEIKIGSAAPLTPRQPLVSAPYAMKSDLALTVPDGSLTASKFASGVLNAHTWLLGGNSGSNTATHFLGTTDNQALVFRTNNTERMRLGSNGNVGIGTATSGFPLAFANTLGDKICLYDSGGGHYGFGIQDSLLQVHSSSAASDIAFGYGSSSAFTETMRIKGNGRVGIGNLNPSAKLEVETEGATAVRADCNLNNGTGIFAVANGPSAFGVHGFSNGGFAVYANGRAGGSTGWQVSSDVRYKEHIATIEKPLDTILNLRGVTFDWKHDEFQDKNFTKGRQIGFIAQEVEPFLPEIVHTDGQGYKSVIYANVVPVLVEAVKAQQMQRQADRAEINLLKGDNATMKARNAELEAILKELAERVNALEARLKK